MALQVAGRSQPFKAPCVLLSGGETTVTVRGNGRGGRNVEWLLSAGITLNGHPRIHALAGDTDGVDGQEEIAGACLAPDSLDRAWALGLRPKDSLANNDGHGFFQALGDSVITGPTLTNRGLIDGAETFIAGATVSNLGSGRIYGDHVAIAASTLTNAAETIAGHTSAAVIAARSRLDLGATTIDNREHALLFSAGDLAIGGAEE